MRALKTTQRHVSPEADRLSSIYREAQHHSNVGRLAAALVQFNQ